MASIAAVVGRRRCPSLAPTHPAGVSLGILAKTLKLDKSTVQRCVAVAVSDGYLVNQETAKGKPAGSSWAIRCPIESRSYRSRPPWLAVAVLRVIQQG